MYLRPKFEGDPIEQIDLESFTRDQFEQEWDKKAIASNSLKPIQSKSFTISKISSLN